MAAPSQQALSEAAQRVAVTLRDADPDRFGTSLLVSPDRRPGLWALYGLNLEAARAPFAASDPILAQMRLQWWINQLQALSEGRTPDRHDVTDLLAAYWGRSAGTLIPLVEARVADCDPQPMRSVPKLLDYIDATAGVLMGAAAEYLAGQPVPVAELQGRAQGIAAWLRAEPQLATTGRGLAATDGNAVIEMRRALGRAGGEALRRARTARNEVPRAAWPALYLGDAKATLTRAVHGQPPLAENPLSRRWRLAKFALSHRW